MSFFKLKRTILWNIKSCSSFIINFVQYKNNFWQQNCEVMNCYIFMLQPIYIYPVYSFLSMSHSFKWFGIILFSLFFFYKLGTPVNPLWVIWLLFRLVTEWGKKKRETMFACIRVFSQQPACSYRNHFVDQLLNHAWYYAWFIF